MYYLKRFYVFMLMVLCLGVFSSAILAKGTDAGDTISNTVYLSADNASETNFVCVDTNVSAVFGETTADATDLSQHGPNATALGDTAMIFYEVYNTGNGAEADSFTVNVGELLYTGGSSDWSYAIIAQDGTSQGTAPYVIGPIAEDGMETFAIQIVIPDSITLAPNGSIGYCTVQVTEYSNPFTGEYLGDNGESYAHLNSSVIWTDTATVSAAVFEVTKICTGTTLAGVASAPIPGATLWYEIEYSNIGDDSGLNVFIYDKIDTDAVFDIETVGSATGWTFYHSTAATPTPVFGASADWTLGVAGTKSDMTWIKWDKALVGIEEDTQTLGYTVIIK